jgi:hypothetical protein
LLAIIGTSAVFAQNTGKYVLEIYNISQATHDTLERGNPNWTREDDYFFVRTASGTTVRDKGKDLSLEQVRQKLLAVAPQVTGWVNHVNNQVIPDYQQRPGFTQYYSGVVRGEYTGSPQFRIFAWIRRVE